MDDLLNFLNSIHSISRGFRDRLEETAHYREVGIKTNLLFERQICANIYFVESGLFVFFIGGMERKFPPRLPPKESSVLPFRASSFKSMEGTIYTPSRIPVSGILTLTNTEPF